MRSNNTESWETPDCIFCKKAVDQHFNAGTYHLNLKQPLRVVCCPDCHLLFLSPRPGERLRKNLMKGIVPTDLQDYGKSLANYSAVNQNRSEMFQRRLNILERFSRKRGKLIILDVGSSGGAFLKETNERGWSSFGIEPSSACFSSKFELVRNVQAEAENIPFADDSFDIVHANHVFEHLANPHNAAQEVNRVLKPGGVLFLEVPNQLDNIMFLRDKLFNRVPQRKRAIRSIHHLFFFSKKTIIKLLKEAGFVEITVHDFYSWRSRGWRLPMSIATRFAGLFFGGGDRIQAWAYKSDLK